MAFLHGLALFLLCLVGYATGVVGTAGLTRPQPSAPELLLTAVSGLVAALWTIGLVGHWATFPLAVGFGAAPGVLAGLARRIRTTGPNGACRTSGPLPSRPSGDEGESDEIGVVRDFLLRIGDFQGRVTMGWLYFVLLAPFAVISRFGADPLSHDLAEETYWCDRPSREKPEEDEPMTRQY